MAFMLWSIVDRDDIADTIDASGRHAPALEMDALFGLVRGNAGRYLDLEDPDYSIFEKAWLAASGVQRQRISTTVLKSQDPRLVAAYDHAVKEGHDPQLVIEALKLCGDHDALLDRLHGLPFTGALEVIAFWEESDGRPKTPSKKVVVEAVVALYRELAGLLPQSRPSAPPGTRDIFSLSGRNGIDPTSCCSRIFHARTLSNGPAHCFQWRSGGWFPATGCRRSP